MNEYFRMLDLVTFNKEIVQEASVDDWHCIQEQLFAEYLMQAGKEEKQ